MPTPTIPNSITDLDPIAANNSPKGSDDTGGAIDDLFRAHAAIIRKQFSVAADIVAASALPVPDEGSYVNVTGTATILTFDDSFPGRVVWLRFEAGAVLTHSSSLILPGGANIKTKAGDLAQFVNESAGVWRCLYYPNDLASTSKFVGEVFAIRTDLDGAQIPPATGTNFRYISLTAADSYNDGALTGESVSGSAPDITATAVIDFPASPFHGETINLINTERRTLRAGESGTLQNDAIKSHTHTGSTNTDGGHSHTGTTNNTGAHTHAQVYGIYSNRESGNNDWYSPSVGGNTGAQTQSAGAHSHTLNINVTGSAHSHNFTTNASGTTENRVRNQGVAYYMRIA